MINTVFNRLVGQQGAIEDFSHAVAMARKLLTLPVEIRKDQDFSQAWLITGPPGSGRSIGALCFAAALQCHDSHLLGCGQCKDCLTTMSNTHPDLCRIIPEGLSIGVAQTRELIQKATRYPSVGNWQIILIEDADRLTDEAVNVLLKVVEEPPSSTIFLFCSPSVAPQDIAITLRSRCRHVGLVTPTPEAITTLLINHDGIDPSLASWAASVSGGHIGRARRLATDPQARYRRKCILHLPEQVINPGQAYLAGEELVSRADEETTNILDQHNKAEVEQLRTALGAGGVGKGTARVLRGTAGLFKDLDRKHKSRHTRGIRDSLDLALVDLMGYFRDALLLASNATDVRLNHPDMREQTSMLAQRLSADQLLVCLEALITCRADIDANVKPKYAIDALMARLTAILNPSSIPSHHTSL